MKVIGIIGGMSAESTQHYYARINAGVRARLGGQHAAEVLIWSVDFDDIVMAQKRGDWEGAGRRLADVAQRLERAGADCVLLATNTMHKVADAITSAIAIPFIHIGDATADAVKAAGLKRPGLMATAYTMEQDFYTGRLARQHGLEVIVPEESDRRETHRIIYDELCNGKVTTQSRMAYEAIAQRLVARGADSLILGCTEVGMLLNSKNVTVPVFDTTLIHADAAVAFALADQALKAAE